VTYTNLRRIRKERGFKSCRALASAVGLSYQAIHTWEHGTVAPRPYNGAKLAAVLQTPLEVLIEPESENDSSAEALEPPASTQLARNTERTKAVSYA
jgi:transcriptional regulator with XRE-family HTH domain